MAISIVLEDFSRTFTFVKRVEYDVDGTGPLEEGRLLRTPAEGGLNPTSPDAHGGQASDLDLQDRRVASHLMAKPSDLFWHPPPII